MDRKRIMFFDLETNGLPTVRSFGNYYPYEETKYYDTSRIVQIAIRIYKSNIQENKDDNDDTSLMSFGDNAPNPYKHIINKTYALERELNYVVKPDDFKITNDDIHNISQTMAEQVGIPFNNIMDELAPFISECDLLIAHNIAFDKHVLLSEMCRHGKSDLALIMNSIQTYCTALNTAPIMKLRFRRTQFKMPKLSELYKYLFNRDASGLHDAIQDVKVMTDCFFKLLELGLVK